MLASTTDLLRLNHQIYWTYLKQPILKIAGCDVVLTKIPSPWLNGVIASSFSESATAHSVTEVVTYFKNNNTPFAWWSDANSENSSLSGELQKHGIQCQGDFSGMVLDMQDLVTTESPQGFVIEAISNDQISTFVDILCEAYEAGDEVKFETKRLFTTEDQSPIIHFLGRENGKPVAAGSLFLHEAGAAIYHVGTIPEARRKGYATALMDFMLQRACEVGCDTVVLVSTPMANGMYQRLGFRIESNYHLYI